MRWERFNTARSYADLGPGLTPSAAAAERVYTVGANFQVSQGIVVKADLPDAALFAEVIADLQRFRSNRNLDRFDLGLGWSF